MVKTEVEKVVREGTRVLSVVILVGKFSLKFVKGRKKPVARANLNGERGPNALFVPPEEYNAAVERSAAIFNEERSPAQAPAVPVSSEQHNLFGEVECRRKPVVRLPRRARQKRRTKDITGQGALFA